MVTKRLADLAMTLAIKSLSAIFAYSMPTAIPQPKVGRRGHKQVGRLPYDTFGHIFLHIYLMLGILCTLAPSGMARWFISRSGDATMTTLIDSSAIFQSCWASRLQWHEVTQQKWPKGDRPTSPWSLLATTFHAYKKAMQGELISTLKPSETFRAPHLPPTLKLSVN